MNTYTALIDRLLALPKYSDGVGFRRMAHLLTDVADTDWWRTCHHFHIVGTDGKGSTAALLGAILAPWCRGVGRYTSPHLMDFRERITLDGAPISVDALLRIAPEVLRQAREWADTTGGQMAAFEVFTAIAARHWSTQNPEAAVWEAGIGGRLDPTRWMGGHWAALTSVGLDHTALLGPTMRHIALDKMEVLRPGGTLVVGIIAPELREEIALYAALKEIEVVFVEDCCTVGHYALTPNGCQVQVTVEGWALPWLELELTGKHQLSNLQVALLLAKRWLAKHRPTVDEAAFAERLPQALKGVAWPGRFQQVQAAPPVYVDVGHTAQAYAQVAALTRQRAAVNGQRVIGVLGISEGKSAEELVDAFAGCFVEWIVTKAQHRGSAPHLLADVLAQRKIAAQIAPDSSTALAMATQSAQASGAMVVVVGSLFLAVEVAQLCAGKAVEDLRFF